jgi:TonB dependent receptor-like, beta-barrel/Carboxypeptidase regulatory-like domain/TonB-dependent Receptor Plug Domain
MAALLPLAWGTIFGNLRGIVHDPDHRPIPGATVVLQAADSEFTRTVTADGRGEFEFSAVPLGDYVVKVSSPGMAPLEERAMVTSGSAPILHFQLQLASSRANVEVSETAEAVAPETSTPSTMITRAEIQDTPGADRTNSLAMITDYVPGAYMTHDQLHVRGGHQVTWSVDGVEIPNTNIASNVGPQFDPKDVDYMEVQRGGSSAEYGDRTYAAFNIVPRTGFERDNEAEVVTSFGNFYQTNDQISFGGHSERFAYYASLNGNRSDLGLETPGPEVLHDRDYGLGGFSTLIFNPDAANQLRLVTSLRHDRYQIPNTPDQEAAGMDDVERESDDFTNFSWVHTASPGVLLTISPFFHFNRSDYVGGPQDVPLSTQDNRASYYEGGQAAISAVTDRHNARAGLYSFAQQDHQSFGLIANDGSGLALNQALQPSGNLEAAFAEDQFKPMRWLTLNAGVRLTHFGGSISENAADPRLGAALLLPWLHWTLHGFYGRYYQPPPLSTVNGPVLDYALAQGVGFLPLRGERDEEVQFGLTIPVRGWLLDVNHFHTHARNYFDHDALGNSDIFFPLTIDGARIRAWEVTVESPLIRRRARVHLAYSYQVAEGSGAVSGGLTDFSPPEEGYFYLDHDQRHTLNTGFFLRLPVRSYASGNVYYGSGFLDGDGPGHLPGHTTVDLSLGKDFGETWSVSLNALNAANRRFLLDNSLTFGGTHYADPRQVYAEVRYRFHY